MVKQIQIYRIGLRVERLHTVPHLLSYSNGHHSANAALIAHEICKEEGISSSSVVLYMLMHDVAEGYTGDVPANVKRDNGDLKFELDRIEDKWVKRNLPDMPDLSHEEKAIAKAADLIELGMHCTDEIFAGNRNVKVVLMNVVNYLHSMYHIKSVKKITEKFLIGESL